MNVCKPQTKKRKLSAVTIDITCVIEGCKTVTHNGIHCRAHYVMKSRYGTYTPTFICRSCGDPYVYISKHVNNKDWCNSCMSLWDLYFENGSQGAGNKLFVYGMTILNYHELVVAHEGRCKICGQTSNKLTIDHNHQCCSETKSYKSCGRCIRGLLCSSCNTMLGYYENHSGPLVLDVFDKYLSEPCFIFSTPIRSEMNTIRERMAAADNKAKEQRAQQNSSK